MKPKKNQKIIDAFHAAVARGADPGDNEMSADGVVCESHDQFEGCELGVTLGIKASRAGGSVYVVQYEEAAFYYVGSPTAIVAKLALL